MSDNYVWEPVRPPFVMYGQGKRNSLRLTPDNELIIYLRESDSTIEMGLPDDLRLCRRVPAQGVPVEAIRRLIEFVDEWGSIGDTEGMPNLWIEVQEARTWLDRATDAQPQPGQEERHE